MSKEKHYFLNRDDVVYKFVRCSKCHELITPGDIENFNNCPYCNAPLGKDMDLDDFVLEPLVQHWMQNLNYPGHSDGRNGRRNNSES